LTDWLPRCRTAQCTHTGEGGPIPPAIPPKRATFQFTYTFYFNKYDQITKIHQVFDLFAAWKGLGWPFPGE
jgi:hypothetical protein